MSYSAVSGGTQSAVVPLVYKNYYGNWTGISVQNVGFTTANVSVFYYNRSGGYVAQASQSIPPNSVGIFYPAPVSDGFIGSARVTNNSSQGIAVAVNHITSLETSGDSSRSHGGVSR